MRVIEESHQANPRALMLDPVDGSVVLPITVYLKRSHLEDDLHQPHHDTATRKHTLKKFRHSHYTRYVRNIGSALDALHLVANEPEMRCARFTGTVDQLNSTFNITLTNYKDEHGRDFISFGGSYSLPDSIADIVESVQGLNTRLYLPPRKQ